MNRKAGGIFSYIHHNVRVGVLLELGCETDAATYSESFRVLAQELTLQIASTAPTYISVQDMPHEMVKEAISYGLRHPSIPTIPECERENVIKCIVDGKLSEQVLLMQRWVKDESVSVSELIERARLEIGEEVVVRRFERFALTE